MENMATAPLPSVLYFSTCQPPYDGESATAGFPHPEFPKIKGG